MTLTLLLRTLEFGVLSVFNRKPFSGFEKDGRVTVRCRPQDLVPEVQRDSYRRQRTVTLKSSEDK